MPSDSERLSHWRPEGLRVGSYWVPVRIQFLYIQQIGIHPKVATEGGSVGNICSEFLLGSFWLAVGSFWWAVGSGQLLLGSGQLLAGSGQWAASGWQWAASGGQWAVGSFWLTVGSFWRAVGSFCWAVGSFWWAVGSFWWAVVSTQQTSAVAYHSASKWYAKFLSRRVEIQRHKSCRRQIEASLHYSKNS